ATTIGETVHRALHRERLMRDVFGSLDLCSVVCVIGVLHVAGRMVEKYIPARKDEAHRIGVLTFLVAGAAVYYCLAPWNSGGVLASVLAGLLVAEAGTIIAALLLPVLAT